MPPSTPKMRPLRILLLGAPGSGKGTQTTRLLRRFPHLSSVSSGDLLRSNIANKTPVGIQAEKYVKSGKLIPDATMTSLIGQELADRNWLKPTASWLLDGFPRTAPQAEALQELLEPHGADLNLVVELDVDEKVILDRIENRWVHLPSGRVYNLSYNPPKIAGKDDITGEPLSKRADDNAEVFRRRMAEYRAELGPLKEFYGRRGCLYTIAGDTSDVIYPKLEALVMEKFGPKL